LALAANLHPSEIVKRAPAVPADSFLHALPSALMPSSRNVAVAAIAAAAIGRCVRVRVCVVRRLARAAEGARKKRRVRASKA
jgi:hypothetical protein